MSPVYIPKMKIIFFSEKRKHKKKKTKTDTFNEIVSKGDSSLAIVFLIPPLIVHAFWVVISLNYHPNVDFGTPVVLKGLDLYCLYGHINQLFFHYQLIYSTQ